MALTNKTIIITGASSGIGAVAARLFASEGANVVLAARRTEELRSVAEDIAQSGGRVVWRSGDVLDESYLAMLTVLALQNFGSLHGAVARRLLRRGEPDIGGSPPRCSRDLPADHAIPPRCLAAGASELSPF